MYVLCSRLCSPHFNNFKWWAGNISNSTFYMLKEFHVEGVDTRGQGTHLLYSHKILHSSTSSFCLIITFTWLSHTMWTVGKKCVQILTKTSLCPIQILRPRCWKHFQLAWSWYCCRPDNQELFSLKIFSSHEIYFSHWCANWCKPAQCRALHLYLDKCFIFKFVN